MNNIEQACSQVDYIIDNLDEVYARKIPYNIKNFFKNNKSNSYKVELDFSKPLYEQDLLEETKMYIQIVFKLFIAPKSEKDKYIADARRLFIEKNTERWLENNKK